MAKASASKPATDAPPPAVKAAPAAEPLALKALAEGILARTIRRPRVGDIRRLAEAVLKPDKKKKKKAAKKAERKLSKIPAQKGRK